MDYIDAARRSSRWEGTHEVALQSRLLCTLLLGRCLARGFFLFGIHGPGRGVTRVRCATAAADGRGSTCRNDSRRTCSRGATSRGQGKLLFNLLSRRMQAASEVRTTCDDAAEMVSALLECQCWSDRKRRAKANGATHLLAPERTTRAYKQAPCVEQRGESYIEVESTSSRSVDGSATRLGTRGESKRCLEWEGRRRECEKARGL